MGSFEQIISYIWTDKLALKALWSSPVHTIKTNESYENATDGLFLFISQGILVLWSSGMSEEQKLPKIPQDFFSYFNIKG